MVKCKIVDVVHFLRLATRSRSFASSWPPLSLPMLPPSLPARFSCPFFASDIPVFHIVLKRFEKAFPSFSCESTRKSSPILKFLTTSSLKILQSPPQVQIQLFSFALPLTLALPGRWRIVDLEIWIFVEIWRFVDLEICGDLEKFKNLKLMRQILPPVSLLWSGFVVSIPMMSVPLPTRSQTDYSSR